MKKHIPNIITCCNLICGCIAVGAAFQNPIPVNYFWAIVFILLGAIFDFFDGMVARALGVSSPIGKELDSLADVVTFGVAPSAMLFSLFQEVQYPEFMEPLRTFMPYTAFIFTTISQVQYRHTTDFIFHRFANSRKCSFLGKSHRRSACVFGKWKIQCPISLSVHDVVLLPVSCRTSFIRFEIQESFLERE